MKKKIYTPYRPSSGCESMDFKEKFCAKCIKDSSQWPGDGCDDIANRSRWPIKSHLYPQEWIYDNDGQPTCTAFKNGEII